MTSVSSSRAPRALERKYRQISLCSSQNWNLLSIGNDANKDIQNELGAICCWALVRGMIVFLHWVWKPSLTVRLLPPAVKLLHIFIPALTVPCPYSTLLLPWICTRGWLFYVVLSILKQVSKYHTEYLSFIDLGYQCIQRTVCKGKNCFTRPGLATLLLGSHSLVQNMPWVPLFFMKKERGRKKETWIFYHHSWSVTQKSRGENSNYWLPQERLFAGSLQTSATGLFALTS